MELGIENCRPNTSSVEAAVGFVALSKFVVANELIDEVKRAFVERPHLVDSAPGYIRMDVISPIDNPYEIWLITYWTDEESFRQWHRSHEYHESHRAIPKGLRLVPKSASVRYFEYISA
ncbi:MAG: antibiotic biosynthesis monooxygenase [Pyrinomonadaceae bacterium]|nr:antibiotic biosynthesis monooxygenase [Pyrinomonadaceae bacterium]